MQFSFNPVIQECLFVTLFAVLVSQLKFHSIPNLLECVGKGK